MKRIQFPGLIFLICTFWLGTRLNAAIYDVTTFGAKGDGKTVDTPAVNKAIEAAAEAGGGTVHFPAGTYLCFSIRLKSNITLFLDSGAMILAASPDEHNGGYDPAEPNEWGDKYKYQDYGHSHWHDSLIWGENLENIAIVGPGMIWGKGLRKWDTTREGVGNKSIALKNCKHVLLRDFTILKGGHFGILPTAVDDFTIDNLKIDTNRDGINVDCCRNVRISNCAINSPNDDGIVLKSSFALGYARMTENVTITNCQLSGYDEGTFLDGTYKMTQKAAPDRGGVTGRIKFGTESNGGFRNITISNCTFEHCRGLALETVDGGLLEDVTVSNITMRDLTCAPFFLRLASRMRGPEGVPVGKLRRINISNVVIDGAVSKFCAMIMGVPGHEVEDVRFNNIKILFDGGAPIEQSEFEVPEKETGYPDPHQFEKMPAYGFFIRHAKGIELNNVDVRYMETDFRPAFILDDVKDADFFHVKAQKTEGVPTFVLKNVENIVIDDCEPVGEKVIKNAVEKRF